MSMTLEHKGDLAFGRYAINRRTRELRCDGRPIELGSRAFEVLMALVEADGALVAKDMLMDRVWPGTAVEENNLQVQISTLRKALGGERDLIQTVTGRGYRFIGVLRSGAALAEAPIPEQPMRGTDADTDPECRFVPRLSIVVLPFTNLSDDRDQQYFADGITEDLTTDLSRIVDLLVISRHTAFTYRTKPTDVRQIGRELGVRYVLDGTVRRLGDQIRVSTQLVDAETDIQLWAERFDGATNDLFVLQNEITSRIAIALDLELVRAEVNRPTIQLNALDYILRGRHLSLGRVPTRRNHAEQIALFERAPALDPASGKAQGLLAAALTSRVLDQMADSAESDIARAEVLAGRALAAYPHSALPHFARAQVLRAQRRFEDAIPEYETVIALNRNWVFAIAALGFCRLMTGSIEAAIPAQERAIRLSPRDPRIWLYYFWTGQAHLLQSRVDEAIPWFEKGCRANPEQPLPHAYLASAYALKGDAERAKSELAQARALSGDDRYSSLARLKAAVFFGAPKTRALFEATYFTGLRKAGMPDGASLPYFRYLAEIS